MLIVKKNNKGQGLEEEPNTRINLKENECATTSKRLQKKEGDLGIFYRNF